MKYCAKCLMPSTKPHIKFDEDGVCSACASAEQKSNAQDGIDWDAREKEFEEYVRGAKAANAPFFDALVPVSGGKDSISQVHRLLDKGLRILAVNIDYGIKTDIGHYNLNCIPEMGANLFIYKPEQKLHKKLIRLGFEKYGDPDLMSHTLLHAGPLRVALQFKIPLVLLGENSAFEYSGDSGKTGGQSITRDWFTKYAACNGHDANYVSKEYDIPFEKLVMYDFPDELVTSNTKAVFASHYFFWDSERNLEIAEKYGFKSLESAREGTYRKYVGIDEKINRIHQYMKVLKFGYGRATDHACEDIRNGRITRGEAKKLVAEYDLQDLSEDYINSFAEYLEYTPDEVRDILEKFRNKEIWQKDHNGNWYIPDHLCDED